MIALRIILAALFVFGICLASGQMFLRAIKLTLRSDERIFLGFMTGTALISNLVFFLATCRMVYTSVLIAGGASILLAWLYYCRPVFRIQDPEPSDLSRGWRILFLAPYLVFGAMYLLAAMPPEISADGTGYHVGLIARYYDHRGFIPITSVMEAGFSAGIEMLFWIGFALGRHSAAAVIHLLFLLTLPFGMLAFARRIKVPEAGVIGALLFYLAPVVGKDGTIAYIDVATAAVVFGAVYFLEIWRSENQPRALIPAGILAGFAYACKLTAGTTPVYADLYVVVAAYARGARWRDTCRLAGSVGVLALAVAAPWLVKNSIQFHNPFYPLFNHWFPNPYLYPIVEDEWRSLMARMSDVTHAQIPYQVTIGGKLTGIIGPIYLLSPLALLSIRSPAGRRLLLAFLAVFLPYFGNIGTRFLIPALPLLSFALAMGLLGIPRIGKHLAVAAVLLHAALSWPTWIELWTHGYQWRIDTLDLRAALRNTPEKNFFDQHWPDYRRGLLLDRFVPPGERVFSPAMGQLAYQHRELIGSFDSTLGRRAFFTLMMPSDFGLGGTWRREFEFPSISTEKIRVVADTKQDNDFRISELRFFHGGAELRRKPEWRLKAVSNPWEIQLAFDNSPVSWWTSGEKVKPGMWVEVDFGAAVAVDRIEIEQSADQRWGGMHPEVQSMRRWRRLPSRESGTEEQPRADLRMRVRDELKAMGIRWILIPDGSYGAADLRNKSPYWGVTQIAELDGFRLWKL